MRWRRNMGAGCSMWGRISLGPTSRVHFDRLGPTTDGNFATGMARKQTIGHCSTDMPRLLPKGFGQSGLRLAFRSSADHPSRIEADRSVGNIAYWRVAAHHCVQTAVARAVGFEPTTNRLTAD